MFNFGEMIERAILRCVKWSQRQRTNHGRMVEAAYRIAIVFVAMPLTMAWTVVLTLKLASGYLVFLDVRDWYRERQCEYTPGPTLPPSAPVPPIEPFSQAWTADERLRLVVIVSECVRRDLYAGVYSAPGRPNIQSIHECAFASPEELESQRDIIESFQREVGA